MMIELVYLQELMCVDINATIPVSLYASAIELNTVILLQGKWLVFVFIMWAFSVHGLYQRHIRKFLSERRQSVRNLRYEVNNIKAYQRVKLQLHSFITSAGHEGKRSSLTPRPPYSQYPLKMRLDA